MGRHDLGKKAAERKSLGVPVMGDEKRGQREKEQVGG